jgi:putative membrane protein
MLGFIRNTLVLVVGVFGAAVIVPGIEFGGRWEILILVALVLALLNALVKPILVLFTLPFIVLSLGLGLMLINALLLHVASRIVTGFVVDGFWPALGGAFIISVTNLLLSADGRRPKPPRRKPRHDDGVVIDV